MFRGFAESLIRDAVVSTIKALPALLLLGLAVWLVLGLGFSVFIK